MSKLTQEFILRNMRIFVLSKEKMLKLVTEEGLRSDCGYITIKCGDETDFAVQKTAKNVLKLVFDDIDRKEEKEDILFSSELATEVLNFFFKMKANGMKTLFVNCGAGVSRSGAIGEAADIFFNQLEEENKEDHAKFLEDNKQIIPNSLVKRLMLKEML